MSKPIAIVAGRGFLPKFLIENLQKTNRKFLIFLLEKEKYEIDYSSFNPIILQYGALETFLKILKENNVAEIIFIGAINKPNFSDIKVDKKGAILVGKILASKILGDDAVLRTVIKFFEKEGFKILKIENLLENLIVNKSILTIKEPSDIDIKNIKIAKQAIDSMSKFDIGQSMIIAQQQIIAVEAIEGTDNMISRLNQIDSNFKSNAILVKMKKRNQSTKADLPTIGVTTIQNCHQYQIKGIAIQANHTLIIEKDDVVKLANDLGMFIIAI